MVTYGGAVDVIADLLGACVDRLTDHGEMSEAAIVTNVTQNTENPLPFYSLATLCRRRGHLDLWRPLIDYALTLPHHSYQQLYWRGQAKLLLDDWSGWRDLESRIHNPAAGYLASRTVRLLRFNTRAWDGQENIEDKTLYVVADGGFSDCLQMLRYVPLIAARAHRLVLCVRPELASLVRQVFGDNVTLTLRGVEDTTSYDRYAWMMSLPALIRALPPLLPLPGVKRDERDIIGICWSGDPEWVGNSERSIPVDALAPLLDHEGFPWCSLQTGASATALGTHVRIRSASIPLYSFAQTAQRIATLSAVVTVDTAVAHLAGMIRVPTWILLSADADSRWGLNGTTQWYPTVRLLRQRVVGDWSDVRTALAAELEAYPWRVATV
jgi:hypothetical protein